MATASKRIGRANFQGASGATYEFAVYEHDAELPAVGGVFLVSGVAKDRLQPDARRIWLIGRSPDMSRSGKLIARHARLEGVGKQLICIHEEDENRRARNRIAKDLAAAHGPQIRLGV